MRNKRVISLITLLFIFGWISQSLALTKDTHKAINEKIAKGTVNGFSLNDYLINNLGFKKGYEETLNGLTAEGTNVKKQIFQWLGYGGEQEDIPVWRAFRHFHNPLEPWDSAGLKGSTLGRSSIIWAQSLDQSYGNYAWQDIRNYFYLALTSLDKTTRESYFAETFRGLGQQMHLVEDASVTMHARDDIHIFYSYEKWVENFRNEEGITFGTWLANAITYDNSILDLSPNPLAPIPIARIIDTDSYDSTNPDITSGLNIGMSEYTNANFFSDDTINSSDFPYPDIDQTTVIERAAPSGNYQRQYYLKNCCGETNGGQGYLLAAVDYLDYYRQQYPLLSSFLPIIPVLDNNVYADYAPLLIPRAVGYSAGLLDYFFRGELYVALLMPSNDGPDVDGIWGNQADTGVNIDKVAVLVQNNSKLDGVIEPIGAGILTLTISYTDTKGTSDPDDDTIEYESGGSISVTEIPETGSGSYIFALFTLTNPIPPQTIEDLTYHLAFKGQLGNETDAVIGRVIEGPVLHSVSPNEGLEGDVLTITGNNLPTIDGPFPTTSDDVRFQHDLTMPYTVEILSKTDTEIIVKVPNTAALDKPEYGGLRVINILDTGEDIYSTSVIFFPIAEGEVTNTGGNTIDVTITADAPIIGDNNQLPLPSPVSISGLAPGASAPVELKTGYTYTATANTSETKDIRLLTPDPIDFTFEVE